MKMSDVRDWDVEQYKTEHESDEHWELRRNFLLAHKDKFPEDELLCLAQVFTNVEFLGCKYPKETMKLIAKLSKDIVGEYRKKQKTRLQRTFVKASDAASSKVKGTTVPKSTSTTGTATNSGSTNFFYNSKTDEIPQKRRKIKEPPFGDIVIVERPRDVPQNTLACAVNVSGGNIEWKYETINNICKCSIFINSKLLAEASNSNQKSAKKEAAVVGLNELQKHYYTIKIKDNERVANVTTTTMKKDTTKEDSISDDNIGKKLMKLMGWAGGGLGKSEQGMEEPVVVKQQINREGLGLRSRSVSMTDLKLKSKEIMRKYLSGDMMHDLVFSSDFTVEERAAIHQVARQLGLKSQSYGPKSNRTLVVSRKMDVRDLVEELKSLGGATSKYQLIEPTGL